jgi:2-haloacid dehalogenase
MGGKAAEFSRAWRAKVLEYSFRRGLMQNYVDFATCTAQALDYTCVQFGTSLSPQARDEMMNAYRVLPVFGDVVEGLTRAQKAGFRMYAFSNGSAAAVETLLRHADIRKFFVDVVSVDEMKSYKPNPAVYSHFLRRAGASGTEAYLISSNPFDVIGAVSAGMRAIWIRRTPDALFDPWDIEPTLTMDSLLDLASQIELNSGAG